MMSVARAGGPGGGGGGGGGSGMHDIVGMPVHPLFASHCVGLLFIPIKVKYAYFTTYTITQVQ